MAPHSRVLAWRIPGTGEPGGLPSMGLHRVGYDWSDLAAAALCVCVCVCVWSDVKVAQLCPILCDPMNYTVHEILQARILEWVAFPFSRGSSQSGIESRSPTLQGDSPAEPQGKPKNTGVGSLSFLQQIFTTQELNQGLLHCKWIYHQLSYQGSIYTHTHTHTHTHTQFIGLQKCIIKIYNSNNMNLRGING